MTIQKHFLTDFRARLLIVSLIGMILGWVIIHPSPEQDPRFYTLGVLFVGIFIQIALFPLMLYLSYGKLKIGFIAFIIIVLSYIPILFLGFVLFAFLYFPTAMSVYSILGIFEPLIDHLFSSVFSVTLEKAANYGGKGISLNFAVLFLSGTTLRLIAETISLGLAMLISVTVSVAMMGNLQHRYLKDTTCLPPKLLMIKGTIVSFVLVALFLKFWDFKAQDALFGLPKNLSISLSLLPLCLLWMIRGEKPDPPKLKPNLSMTIQKHSLTDFRARLLIISLIGIIVGWVIGWVVRPFFVGTYPIIYISISMQMALFPLILYLSYGKVKIGFFAFIVTLFAMTFITFAFGLVFGLVFGLIFSFSITDILSWNLLFIYIADILMSIVATASVVMVSNLQHRYLKDTTCLPPKSLMIKGTIVSFVLVALFTKFWDFGAQEALFGLPKNLSISLSLLPLCLLWIIRGEKPDPPKLKPNPSQS